ncbi:MAG: class I SAM-dependent methyltransferase [Solirubrobacteraceae bacterium]
MPDKPGALWDRRFAQAGWSTRPDSFLVELAEPLPPARGVDLGAGPGRNSLWLASRGWSMTLVDLSEVGLAKASAVAEELGVSITTLHADVATWTPDEGEFDLVIIANLHPRPDTLVALLANAAKALRPGGYLYVVGHHLDNLGHHGPPDPERLLTAERLRAALPPTLEVVVLDTRERSAGHSDSGQPGRTDRVVFAWSRKPSVQP